MKLPPALPFLGCSSRRVMWTSRVLILGWHIVLGVPTSSAGSATEDAQPLRIVFSESMFANVNPNDAKASVKAWAQQVADELGMRVNLDTWIEPDLSTIQAGLVERRVEMVAITTREFLGLEETIAVGTMLLGKETGRATQEYVVITAASGSVRTLADLRGRSLVAHENPRTCFALPWLEILLRRDHQSEPVDFFSAMTTSTELTGVVLPVFFGNADACLVTRAGYELMVELNPQVGRVLRELISSPPVVPMVLFIREDVDPELRDNAVRALLGMDQSASGRQLLTLFHTPGLRLATPGALDSARSLAAGHIPPSIAAPHSATSIGMD